MDETVSFAGPGRHELEEADYCAKGEIRATGFNDAVDNFYNLLEVGKVFFVSRARINIAKKQFSNVSNEYEIMFERDTEIEPCADESVPQVKYNFKGIGDLGELQKDDVCGTPTVFFEGPG